MDGFLFCVFAILMIVSDAARRRLLVHVWKEDRDWAEAMEFHPPTFITSSMRKQRYFSRAIWQKEARLMRTAQDRRLFWMAYVGEIGFFVFGGYVLLRLLVAWAV